MILPPDHSLRAELNDEVHARPPDALAAPVRATIGPRRAPTATFPQAFNAR